MGMVLLCLGVLAVLGSLAFIAGMGVGARRGKGETGQLPIEAVFSAQSGESEGLRNAIFAKVFNLVPETLTITRIADGCFVEVNRNWETLTGFTYQEAIGHTSNELGVWVIPEQREHIIQCIRRDGEVHNVDVTFLHKQGHLYYNRVSASLFEVQGEKYMMLSVQDVSAERQVRQQLLDLNQQLEDRVRQRTISLEKSNAELAAALETLERAKDDLIRTGKMAALGALVAGVAHELNTPIGNGLTVATTFEHRLAELGQSIASGLRRSTLDEFMVDARAGMELLVRNLTRAGELVRSFKQVAVDQSSSQRREFSLAELISEIVLALNQQIRDKGCQVTVRVEDGLIMDSYPGPLGQVLSGLITNALVHGFAGQRHGTLEIGGRSLSAQKLEIVVKDDGVGINPEDLKRLFDPFFTTRLGQGSSGLGLHIVENIVTSVLCGKVEVSSQIGQGAVFTLRLPMVVPSVASSNVGQ